MHTAQQGSSSSLTSQGRSCRSACSTPDCHGLWVALVHGLTIPVLPHGVLHLQPAPCSGPAAVRLVDSPVQPGHVQRWGGSLRTAGAGLCSFSLQPLSVRTSPRIIPWLTSRWKGSGVVTTPMSYKTLCQNLQQTSSLQAPLLAP